MESVAKVFELGERLRTLHPDDGPLLAELLQELAQEAKREPRSLIASTAYNSALVLAGMAREARHEAIRGLELWRRLPGVPPSITLNLFGGLCDGGLEAEAKHVVESLDARALNEQDARRRLDAVAHLGVRYGEIEWWKRRSRDIHLNFLITHGLADDWRTIMSAIEEYLHPHVAALGSAIDDDRLVLQYWTDSHSYAEINQLQDGVWDEVDRAVAAGAVDPTERVVFMVYGPQIPIEEIEP